MLFRCEIIFRSRIDYGFVGNNGFIRFYGIRGKLFYFLTLCVKLNVRNLEVCAFVAVHYELHSNARAVFRDFHYQSYFRAVPTTVPVRIAHSYGSLSVRVTCRICSVRQESDLVTACICQVRTDVFYVHSHFHAYGKFSTKHKDAFASCRTYYLQISVYDFIADVLFFTKIINLLFRREIIFRSRIYYGLFGNNRIGLYGIRGKLFYFLALCVKLNVRNLEVCAFVAVHYELHSNARAVFRDFHYQSYFRAVPTTVPVRIAHSYGSLSVRVTCRICSVRQESDLVTACIRQVRTDVFYVHSHFHACGKFSTKYKDAFASCRTYYLQISVYDFIADVLFFTKIIDLLFRCEIIFRSRIDYGFVGNNGFIRFYGIRGKLFHFFVHAVNSDICNLEIRIFFVIEYELQSKPCAVSSNFRNQTRFCAVPTTVPRRVANHRRCLSICIACRICSVRQEGNLSCFKRHVFTNVFYVYRNLHACGKITFKHKDIRVAFYPVYLQIVSVFIFHDRIGYVFCLIKIIDLVRRCKIKFRSLFNHGRRYIACVFNSNARNLPICICVANITELNT